MATDLKHEIARALFDTFWDTHVRGAGRETVWLQTKHVYLDNAQTCLQVLAQDPRDKTRGRRTVTLAYRPRQSR